jgi:hypothetical protein
MISAPCFFYRKSETILVNLSGSGAEVCNPSSETEHLYQINLATIPK